MALSSLHALSVSPLPLPVGRDSPVPWRGIILAGKAVQPRVQLKQSNCVQNLSRRDVISLSSFALLTAFLATGSADARPTRSEGKRTAKEKLEKLREKAVTKKEEAVILKEKAVILKEKAVIPKKKEVIPVEKAESSSIKNGKSAPNPSFTFSLPTTKAKIRAS